ncbi:MAG TPA: hypothetical protein VFH88_06355 [Candidatus Krumholzibacteria bacterium]|nr:hypothetical protein [Candidatus Krumholzibacteria bacterium]
MADTLKWSGEIYLIADELDHVNATVIRALGDRTRKAEVGIPELVTGLREGRGRGNEKNDGRERKQATRIE